LREEGAGAGAGGTKPEAVAASDRVSGGGIDSAPSSCSSWTAWGDGDVTLGGSSLREFLPPGDVAGRVGTLAGLLFLKARGLPESSLSEFISSTLFPLSGRAGA